MSFAIFNEEYYLNSYPDVRTAVNARAVSSGFAHFQQYGLAEGRVNVSPYFDEALYLRKYPDVAAVVGSGSLKSGLQHYIQYGEAEGRSPGSFDEQAYLALNPDVAAAVKAGTVSSGLQHYIQYGIKENRVGWFVGSNGNDVVTGVGEGFKFISGVPLETSLNGSPTAGVGQVDTLIGSPGSDLFALGLPSIPQFNTTSQKYYVGSGNSDYATIQNFQQSGDFILLSGTPQEYQFQTVNGNLNISTTSGDLMGIVQGVPTLALSSTDAGVPIGTAGTAGNFFFLV